MTEPTDALSVPLLLTERLHIRPLRAEDALAMHAYMSDAATMMWLPEGTFTLEQVQTFIAEQAVEPRAYALVQRSDDVLLGHMVFHPWFAPRTYEIGWVLNPVYHNRGFATEAASALLRWGFETAGLHRIIATCQPENSASYRVMEKLGMRREGHFQKCIYRGNDVWWSEYFYALLETEWFAEHELPQET